MLTTAQMCSGFQALPWRLCNQMRREIKVQWMEVGHRNSMARVMELNKRKMLTNNQYVNQSALIAEMLCSRHSVSCGFISE